MTQVSLEKIIRSVRRTVVTAHACFHTWQGVPLAVKENSQLLPKVENHQIFFQAVVTANYVTTFVYLGNILETRRGSMGLKLMEDRLKHDGRNDLAKVITEFHKRNHEKIKSIRLIRNKRIAHVDISSMESIYQDANVCPNDIEYLIDEICKILNEVGDGLNCKFPDVIPEKRHFRSAVRIVLEGLT